MAISTSTDATPGKFTRGANTGTLVCDACGKRKQVANMAVHTDKGRGVCNPCYDLAGLENAHADGYHSETPDPACPECNTSTSKEQDVNATTDTTQDDPKASMEAHAAAVKAKQAQDRKAAKEAAAAKVAPKAASASKAVKVAKAPKPPKAPRGATKADAVRALLDQGKSVRQIAQALGDQGVSWSYAWDVAAAYEKKLGQPGKFIASRAPGYVATVKTAAKAPVAKKAPVAIDQTPRPKGKRPAKVAATTGDAAVA